MPIYRCWFIYIELIKYIQAKDIIVVTNGLTHVEALLKKVLKQLC